MTARHLAAETMAWSDQWWDPNAALLWNMPGSFDEYGITGRSVHLVQQSAWYALGLLHRNEDGDVVRAEGAINALCAAQYDTPGTAWHGTFARFLEWPEPSASAVEWIDYDPNWREFVGTALLVALREFRSLLRADVITRMEAAIALAVEGEPDGRVSPDYTNIALMKAWLDVEAGRIDDGERLASAVVDRFRENGAFLEYGSPTYYGVDLYALALWRSRSSSERLRAWGSELETAMWRDIARWYHAGLRNLCGPYARAYGMDMTQYASLLGLWMWEALSSAGETDDERVPFPSLEGAVGHSADVCFGPVVNIVGAAVPEDALAALRTFRGAHDVRQVVSSDLGFVASGWVGDDVMVGGASGSRARAEGQFHPATVHWRAPDGTVGWLRLVHAGPIEAVASKRRLDVTVLDHPARGEQPTTVESSHPGTFTPTEWVFPGLSLQVEGIVSGDGPAFELPGGTRFSLVV